MSAGRGGPELSTDHVLLIIVCSIGVSVMIARRQTLLAGIGVWLRDRQLLVDGPTLVSIPGLGGLDLGRVLITAGVALTVLVVLHMMWRTSRGTRSR